MKDEFAQYIGYSLIDTFAEWAFGKDYSESTDIEIMKKWNELHKTDHEIKPDDLIEQSMKKMVGLWIEHLQGKKR